LAAVGNSVASGRPLGRIRTFGRLLVIVAVTATALGVYAAGRAGTLFVFDRARRARAVARLRGRVLRRTLTILGPTFIKMGQVLSTRPDLLRPDTIDELRRLQDRLPAFRFAHVARVVEEDLGGPIDTLFTRFDRTPIAAASVAQVHRAQLADGTEVAVKILRPNIRAKIERDSAVLVMLGRLFMLHPMARQNDAVGHIRELVKGIVEQTDLVREADSLDRFRTNFADVAGVIFPRPYRERSGPRVLTMSYLEGKKLDEDLDGHATEVGELVRTSFYKMCFDDGFVHADLHPGNMLVTQGGELAIFDAGLVKSFDERFFDEFFSFARCLVLGTPADFVNHFRGFHTYLTDVKWDAMENDVGDLMTRFQNQTAAELETSNFSNDMFALFRKYHIRPLPEITLVLVGSLTSEGIGKMLEPTRNQFQDIASYIVGVMLRKLAASGAEPREASGQLGS
jgi:ubiquinone biosynthesis protein